MNFQWLEQLETKGFAVLDSFLDRSILENLKARFDDKLTAGQFRAAGIGQGAQHLVSPDVRGDEVLWLDLQNLDSNEMAFIRQLDQIKERINQDWFLGLWDWEGHYAHYPVGTFYKKHLDRFKKDDARTLSTVLYLNENWAPSFGGQLVLYPKDDQVPVEIEPLENRLVVFFSDRIPHEVLPGKKNRFSLTGWFRRRRTGNGAVN